MKRRVSPGRSTSPSRSAGLTPAITLGRHISTYLASPFSGPGCPCPEHFLHFFFPQQAPLPAESPVFVSQAAMPGSYNPYCLHTECFWVLLVMEREGPSLAASTLCPLSGWVSTQGCGSNIFISVLSDVCLSSTKMQDLVFGNWIRW